MPRSLTISAASGVNFAFSAMRNTAPCSRPRTSSSVITSLADSSRVTVGRGDAGVNEEEILELGASDSAGIALLKTSRTSARTRSLVSSSAICFDELQARKSRRDEIFIEPSPNKLFIQPIYGDRSLMTLLN